MRQLALTSPHMHGPDVRDLQEKLESKGWLDGTVDGDFGPDTMRACKRAKFWLGYPDKKITGVCGDKLRRLLNGHRLPPSYVVRRALRLRHAQRVPLRLQAIAEAMKHQGEKEFPPGSNVCFYSRWYRLTGPWCAMFATFCYSHVGSKSFVRGSRYAFVPFIVHDAHAGVNGLSITHAPQRGDLVCFDWQRDGTADHVGLFLRWTSQSTFKSIEGNTAVGNDSNGGEVMVRDRSTSDVQAFVHVSR